MTVTNLSYETKYLRWDDPICIVPDGKVMYLDLETYGGNWGSGLTIQHNKVRLISLMPDQLYSCRNVKTGRMEDTNVVFVLDMLKADETRWAEVLGLIESYEIICGHNLAAFDLPVLIRHGLKWPKKIWDTIIASRVLHNGLPYSHGLKSLVDMKLGLEMSKEMQVSDWSSPELSFDQLQYAAMDVAVLQPLHNELYTRMELFKLLPVYDLECSVSLSVADMLLNGVKIDAGHWTERSEAAEKEREVVTAKILREFPRPDPMVERIPKMTKKGTPRVNDVRYNEKVAKYNETRCWNLASPVQVTQMFAKVGVELPDTRYETLVSLAHLHPLIETFIHWRDVEKQAGTFGMEWLKHLHPDGRVYPDWHQLGAASGRFSCSDPNMQQLPRGKTRDAIIAEDGCVLVKADFSQIEARIAAKISGDEVLLDLFNRDEDIFIFTAKRVLGKLEVTPEERQIGKSLVYGLLFSMGPPSLRVYCRVNYGVKLTIQEAEVFRERFFRTYTGLARWHDRNRKMCNYAKEFRSLLGRRRIVAHYAQDPDSTVNMLGLSLNTPVQGSAADMLKIAVAEMWERRAEVPYLKRTMLVHDEVVAEVPEDKAQEAAEWTKNIMCEAGRVILDPVPCRATVMVGRTWGGG